MDSAFHWTAQVREHTVTARDANGKISEANFFVRKPWSSYLLAAREAAVKMPQKASTHCESWYGHFSSFLTRKHLPDARLDQAAEESFREVYALMFDEQTHEPIPHPGRIQNTSAMISMLVDLYEATGSVDDLERAAALADWLISNWQHEDGSYRNELDIHYTSVVYIAKSLLEFILVEEQLGVQDPGWKEKARRHLDSVRRAVDDLVVRRDNVETEGEMTFEDGMISCTALQIALLAIHCDDDAVKARCQAVSEHMLGLHRSLEQLCVPDSRMFGCTLRFWESQYDVLIPHGMMSSPHGWTSWKTYATYHLYLLTGKEHLLRETMDTLGACVQVVYPETEELRWAFAVDSVCRHDQRLVQGTAGGRNAVDCSRMNVIIVAVDDPRPDQFTGLRLSR